MSKHRRNSAVHLCRCPKAVLKCPYRRLQGVVLRFFIAGQRYARLEYYRVTNVDPRDRIPEHRNMRSTLWVPLLFFGCAASTSDAQSPALDQASPDAVHLMILGTYHMAGSSGDLINSKVDNVLSPRRQHELEAVADSLAAFHPTVVLTERVTKAPDYIDPYFATFTDAALKNEPNERVQVGYRLAKHAGVTRVHGIDEQPGPDEPDYFPFARLQQHAEATGQQDRLAAIIGSAQKMIAEESARARSLTIAEYLARINSGPQSAPDLYYALAELDIGEQQPAAELQAYWFMRNAKIWSKIRDVVRPGDRAIVLIGAGHKFWLEHFVRHSSGFELIDPVPLLRSTDQ